MIAVIDVSGNNLTSLANALKRLGFAYVLTHDAAEIQKASQVILPGVGTAPYAMKALKEAGLDEVLTSLTQPILGICLGMQLLLEYSEEGDMACLGLIPGQAKLLKKNQGYPVPHMGWNQLQWKQDSALKNNLSPKDSVYFVHSYALESSEFSLAECDYGSLFTAIVQKNNVVGMQFHPEKSGEVGMTLLKNFVEQV